MPRGADLAALRLERDDERDELRTTTAQLSADADDERLRAERLEQTVSTLTQSRDVAEAELVSLRVILERAQTRAGDIDLLHEETARLGREQLAVLEAERARAAALDDAVAEARRAADVNEARAAVLAATLDEARVVAERERARVEVLAATLQELRDVAEREHAHVALLTETLDEARHQWRATDSENVEGRGIIAGLRAELRAALAARTGSSDDDAVVQRLREEVADATALNESRTIEIAGLRDALLTAREDGRELEEILNAHEARAEALAVALAQHEQALTTAEAAHRDLVDDTAAAAAQRDAALADIEMAETAARSETESRLAMQDELAAVRLELERALATAQTPRDAGAGVAELTLLREKLEAADKHLRARDEKIAEQAERINRLTERIVRTER